MTQSESAAIRAQMEEMLNKQKANMDRSRTASPSAVQPKSTDRAFDIENNTFYKVALDTKLTTDEKREAFVKALTYDLSGSENEKEENRARLAEFVVFKEYLMQESRKMSQHLIELNKSEAFATLHRVLGEMNGGILEFDESMAPLNNIIKAIFELRQHGKETINEMFGEIKADEVAEEEKKKNITEQEQAIAALKQQIVDNKAETAVQQGKKLFIVFGPLKADAKASVARLAAELAELEGKKAQAEIDLQTTKDTPASETRFKGLEAEKAQLQEFLKISAPEQRERLKRLADAANAFVDTTVETIDQVLGDLADHKVQITLLGDTNRNMKGLYALFGEVAAITETNNQAIRTQLAVAPENESLTAKNIRERRLEEVETFISDSNNTTLDTVQAYASLTEQAMKVKEQKDSTTESVNMAQWIRNTGAASVAGSLSAVVTVITSAALNEAGQHVEESIRLLEQKASVPVIQDQLRRASDMAKKADKYDELADRLDQYIQASRLVAEMTARGQELTSAAAKRVRTKADEAQETLNEIRSVQADNAIAGEFQEAARGKKTTQPAANSNSPKKTSGIDPRLAKLG